MEASDQVDLGGDEQGDDPLADVASDDVFDEEPETALPPGVEQGTLGGTDEPFEDEPVEDEEPAAPAEGEYLEEPEEPELEEPEPEEEPQPTAEEQPPPEPEPPAEEPEEPQPEEEPEPTTPVAESPEPEEAPVAPPEAPEPAPKPKPKRGRPRKATKANRAGKGEDVRKYVPFERVSAEASADLQKLQNLAKDGRLWIEHEPVAARSGQLALRVSYRALSGGVEGEFVIAAVPEKLWKPRTVEGKKLDQMAIRIG